MIIIELDKNFNVICLDINKIEKFEDIVLLQEAASTE
jgi:hypothetical protein